MNYLQKLLFIWRLALRAACEWSYEIQRMSHPIERQWFTNHSWYVHVGTSTYPVCPATTVHGICTRSLGWLHLGCSGMMQDLGQWDTQANIQVIQQTTILFPLMLVRLRWQEAGIFSEQINSFDSQLWGNLQFNAFNLITVHSSLQEGYRSQTLNTKCLQQSSGDKKGKAIFLHLKITLQQRPYISSMLLKNHFDFVFVYSAVSWCSAVRKAHELKTASLSHPQYMDEG